MGDMAWGDRCVLDRSKVRTSDFPGQRKQNAIVAQASGTVKSRVTVLMTPEDVDQAVQKKSRIPPNQDKGRRSWNVRYVP